MANTIRPVPLQDIKQLPLPYQRWFDNLRRIVENEITGVIPWTQVDKAGANITDIPSRNHNDLTAFDGGSSGERYHLTASQHSTYTDLTTYTTNQTISSSNGYVLCDATAGNIVITLPAASLRKRFHIKKTDSSVNTVTISRAGSNTIEGSTSLTLTSQYNSYTIYSDGNSTWYIEGQT